MYRKHFYSDDLMYQLTKNTFKLEFPFGLPASIIHEIRTIDYLMVLSLVLQLFKEKNNLRCNKKRGPFLRMLLPLFKLERIGLFYIECNWLE